MSTDVENARPNIRIQIVNNAGEKVDKMDVDEENEEGEISDEHVNDENVAMDESVPSNKVTSSKTPIFTTGFNIFDKKEQEKLQERARRFSLKPNEIHSFSDQDLQNLYDSLGINSTNKTEIKFEKVHLLGLDSMTSEDVVEYFANYAPEGIEWIDQDSCNVVWLDDQSAARALHFKSKVVKGMPAREPKNIFPKEFLDDSIDPEREDGQSILVKCQNREIELQNEIGEIIVPKKKNYPENSVDISEITIPIPPGYWRLGNPYPKTKCLLMRFGRVTDKLPYRTEKCNKYFKKIAVSGTRNVISDVKKKELRSIFERNKELNASKNPWGSLAKNWDKDAKFREREPVMHNTQDDDDDVQIIEIKNPKLQARLGTKRKIAEEGDEVQEKKGEQSKNGTNPKFAPEKKRAKLPRMKMYADEEEENQKRKKILMSIKKQAEEIDRNSDERDLRNMLGPNNRLLLKNNLSEPEPESVDLGSRLKNRSQRMVFAVERDPYEEFLMSRHQMRYLERERSPLLSRSILLQPRARDHRRRLSPDRERLLHRSSRRRTPERMIHSDSIHLSRRRRRSYSPDIRREDQTRSRVAVVVKATKKPSVASTVWSKVKKGRESDESSSESDSESDSENSSSEESSSSRSSSESQSESEESQDEKSDNSEKVFKSRLAARNPDRPGFDKSRLSHKVDHKSPLKITTTNEHFSQKRSRRH